MMKPIYKVLLMNIGIAVLLVVLYFVTAFLLGYGSNTSYAKASIKLFALFAVVHFIVNIGFLHRADTLTILNVAITLVELILIYGVIGWYYNG